LFLENTNQMIIYAQFFIKYNNNIQELLGSDGILPLDKRYNIRNKINIVKNHIEKLNKFRNNSKIHSFEIRQSPCISSTKSNIILHSEIL